MGLIDYHSCPRRLAIFLFVVFAPALSAETLVAGVWKGSYTLDRGESFDVEYLVEHLIKREEGLELRIEMKFVDLEPRARFTYLLDKVTTGYDTVAFEIVKQHEVKTCRLVLQVNDVYKGVCQSNRVDEGSHLTFIEMSPPTQ